MDPKVVEPPQPFVYIEETVPYPVLDTRWLPKSAKFVAMGVRAQNRTGVLQLFELNEGKLDLVREYSQKSGFRCGAFGGGVHRNHLAVADFEGKIQIL